MPIKCDTPESAMRDFLQQQIERRQRALLYNLAYVGEQLRNEAVANGSYKDRTRHLRGSVGYVIAVDGQLVKTGDFGRTDSPTEAKNEGRQFAESLVSRYPKGVVLIVVAGKTYAKYVAAKGYNVIDSAETLAKKLVPEMLHQLGLK